MDNVRLMAFDQSITQTGVAILDGPASRIECLSFSCSEHKTSLAKREEFGMHLRKLISQFRPKFICFEQALSSIVAYAPAQKTDLAGRVPHKAAPRVNAGQLMLPAIESQILQACIDYGIAWDSAQSQTWRVVLKGIGNCDKKEMARAYCRFNRIKANNHNEAEAACIAIWCQAYSQKYRQLRYGLEAAQ